jgi:Zn-dependent protease with chaperone function
MIRRQLAAIGWALAIAALGTACLHTSEGVAKVLVSDEEEKQLGDQVKQELDKQGTKYVQDPQVVQYVQGVAKKIFVSADKDRPGVAWHVYVIDDPKQVNAFATPGGNLFVYTGLLMAADNEAELAGVWGHEAGHVVARHSARQMVDAMGLETVIGMALGQNPNQVAELAATLAAKGALLSYSREDESAADEYGARYASAAGYDPHGLITFFQKLQKMEGEVPAFSQYLSDHPLTADRITHLQQVIAEKKLGGTNLGAERLRPIGGRLGVKGLGPGRPPGLAGGGLSFLASAPPALREAHAPQDQDSAHCHFPADPLAEHRPGGERRRHRLEVAEDRHLRRLGAAQRPVPEQVSHHRGQERQVDQEPFHPGAAAPDQRRLEDEGRQGEHPQGAGHERPGRGSHRAELADEGLPVGGVDHPGRHRAEDEQVPDEDARQSGRAPRQEQHQRAGKPEEDSRLPSEARSRPRARA